MMPTSYTKTPDSQPKTRVLRLELEEYLLSHIAYLCGNDLVAGDCAGCKRIHEEIRKVVA